MYLGEVVMANDPIAMVLDKSTIKEYCSYCVKKCTPRTCGKCHFVGYCSSECQRAHWTTHKGECSSTLHQQPSPLRFLLTVLRLKTESSNKDHMQNMKIFTTEVMRMVSNASAVVADTDKNKMATYAMVCFLKLPEMPITIENFRLIIHVYSLLEVNSFGLSEPKSLLRAGTALYY
jgi:hypothetical protein